MNLKNYPKGRPGGGHTSPPPPPPIDPPDPTDFVGYGRNTTGGAGGTVYNVSTWAAFRTALETPGPRIINITGSATFDANGAEFSLRDSDNQGNVTIDGSAWTGSMKDYKIVFRCSNVIIREVAWRTGEGDLQAQSIDRRAITFNPETGGSIDNVMLDHCSFSWGPDVVASLLNNTSNVTYQYCIFGPGLQYSNNPDSDVGNTYGPNITDTAGGSGYTSNVTYYRCAMIMNKKRNFRAFAVDGWDVVNCAMYDYGNTPGEGNPRGANLVGNMIKKGPETTDSRGWKSILGGANTQNYHLNSVYWPDGTTERNIGLTRTNTSFTFVHSFAAGVRRTTPYDGGPTDPDHGSLIVEPASVALFNTVINDAGRTYQDDVDITIKAHATANPGTSDGYYNGPSTGIPPYPYWP